MQVFGDKNQQKLEIFGICDSVCVFRNSLDEGFAEPPIRNKHEVPSDMVQLDIKQLRNLNEEGMRNSGIGYRHKSGCKAVRSNCMHLLVDVHSRYSSVRIMADKAAESVT